MAVKEFLTASQAEHTGETVGGHGGYEEDDLITQADAMFLFRYWMNVCVCMCVCTCVCTCVCVCVCCVFIYFIHVHVHV